MEKSFYRSISSLSLFLIILISLTGYSSPNEKNSKLATSGGELNFTIRTVSEGGNYAPKHVLAIWVEYESDFVKTRLLRGNSRKQYLYTWKAASNYNVVDAITGATLTSHTTHSVSWDCMDLDGNVVPDGDYTVWVEYTEKHAQGPLYSLTFTKGPDAQSMTPADETYFKDIELDFTPFVSEFTTEATEICTTEEVIFTDESVNATSWSWDFGANAEPSSANTQGPHTIFYSTPGFKTVSLTINDNLTEVKENFIEVLENPVSEFTYSGSSLTVNFLNNSTNATAYSWDFGDGNISTEENPTHIYTSAGNFIVSLNATFGNCWDTSNLEISVPLVGIAEQSQLEIIKISPNPNDGSFTVNISGQEKINKINILDMTGRKTAFSVTENESIFSIQLKERSMGIYFLQIISDNNIYSKKFIVK